ncbi:MAG: hypothetical protein VW378_05150 [bacterium]
MSSKYWCNATRCFGFCSAISEKMAGPLLKSLSCFPALCGVKESGHASRT